MSTRAFFIETVTNEQPIFERVLKAINESNWSYRPDPVTRTGKQVATLIATEPGMLVTILKGEVLDFGTGVPQEPDLTLDQMLAMLSRSFDDIKAAASACSDQDWEHGDAVLKGGFGEWRDKRGKMAWGFLLDLIHHRGQISTYLRAMGGKVPSIYGPSADDSGG
jgi:uncharacterized damage-inducible protein DinB